MVAAICSGWIIFSGGWTQPSPVEHFPEPHEPEFGGRIPAEPGHADFSVAGREVENVAASLPPHDRDDVFHEQEGRAQVCPVQQIEGVGVEFQRAGDADARTVEQHVDTAPFRRQPVDGIAHGLPVAHVEGKGEGRVLRVQPKRFGKFPCRRFEAFRRPRDQGYLVAFPRQFFRRRPADAAASARDQRYGYVRHDEPPG